MPRVLNVGGGSRYLLPMFDGWEQDLLDIDPAVSPDICCSATEIAGLPQTYEAVWCSHNLEHVFHHQVETVIKGFHAVLKPFGFAFVTVPDIGALARWLANHDIHDAWYMAHDTPISAHDVLYGWGKQISKGNEFYAHKTGFTPKSLDAALKQFFPVVHVACDGYNLTALAIKCR